MSVNDFSIKTRLWITFGASIALVTALCATTYSMGTGMSEKQALISEELTTSQMLQDASTALQKMDTPGNDVLQSWDYRTESANLRLYTAEFERQGQEFAARVHGDAQLSTGYAALKPDVAEMERKALQVLDEVARREAADKDGRAADARDAITKATAFMAEMDQAYSTASGKLRLLESIQRARITSLLTDSAAFNKRAVTIAVVLLAASLIITFGMAILLIRSITRPIAQALGIAERIAAGDLREVAVDARDDEIGKLLQAMGQMAKSLRALMVDLRGGVLGLSSSSVQIGGTAAQYAASAVEHSASVAEISATIEELKHTSLASASSAREVADGGDEAATQGREGREQLDKTVMMMQLISDRVSGIADQILKLAEQNSQIGTIVESVNDLAEQSNLLAVNASIEAAQAGEHGRRFAVVAAEVRRLAVQSKRATQQIRAIIADVQKATQSAVMATEEGSKRVNDGRDALEGLRGIVDALAGQLEDTAGKGRHIAATSSQQAAGVSQIAAAIDGISKAGQIHVKGVKQLEQAVLDLSKLASELKETSAKFRVE